MFCLGRVEWVIYVGHMCVDIFRKEIAIVINASHTIGMLLF